MGRLSRYYRSADPCKSHNANRAWFVLAFDVILQWVYLSLILGGSHGSVVRAARFKPRICGFESSSDRCLWGLFPLAVPVIELLSVDIHYNV